MSERPRNASSIAPLFHDPNRGAELAARVEVTLARYPDYIREQITDLLRVLAKRPSEAEKEVR
jgi:hypothetical protein